jgi:two-component system response regulator HydG
VKDDASVASPPGASVLVIDDETFVRDSIAEVLRADGWRVDTASGALAAVEFLARQVVDVIVTDLRMPEGDAFLLLEHAKNAAVEIPIIVITGVGTLAEAVRAMKAGAYDFLQKPVDPEELVLLSRRASEHRRLLGEVKSLRETVHGLRAPRVLVGRSERMERTRALIGQVARTDAIVLVKGESGTGKELAAEEIHRQSARAARPLVRLHCAASSEEAFEQELFASGTGALAEATDGTLVLDEVGVLTPKLQTRLLHLLEEGEVRRANLPRANVRLVAITNEDLAARVKAGGFRADLYWRLDVFPIEMPPLREHKEDIPEIVEHFLEWARMQRTGTRLGAGASAHGVARGPTLTDAAREVLGTYGWPGNVRELRNVLERAVILAGDGELDAALFRGILESALALLPPQGPRELHLRRNLDATEKEILQRALSQTQGRKKEASLLLGIDPRNLGYYLRKHGIAESKSREEGEG